MAVTSVASTGALSGVASANTNDLIKKYESSNNFNEAIDTEKEFVDALLESINESREELDLEVETVSEPDESGEGEVIKKRKGDNGPVPQLNLIRKTESGPLNIIIYPESDKDPFATRTIEDGDKLESFTTGEENNDNNVEKVTESLSGDVTTQHYTCPPSCPTDDDCCECVRECIGCCNESCTPTYTYGCDCCQYTNPSCWGDCY